MILVDSSGWLEVFTGGPHRHRFLQALARADRVVTPALTLYEVYKKILKERTEEEALLAAGQIQKTRVVPLTGELAVAAAHLALQHHLALVDAVIYATAVTEGAELLTLDKDFEGLPHATVIGG